MAQRRVLFQSSCQDELNNLFIAFEKFKKEKSDELQMNVTNSQALTELLSYYNAQKEHSDDKENEPRMNCHQDSEEVYMDEENEDNADNCAKTNFFLCSKGQIEQLVALSNSHSQDCNGMLRCMDSDSEKLCTSSKGRFMNYVTLF